MQPEPRHIAIIMDGNGRWAARRGLPRAEGHRRGVEAVRSTVQAAIELGIPYLTIFSFSSENWSRPETEINDLLGLMKRFIRRDLTTLHRNGVRIRIIGDREGRDSEILEMITDAERTTKDNARLNLIVAFNYGSRSEIAQAARQLAMEVQKGALAPADITPERFAGALQTADVPDPDLLIRTSGEHRLSNFLLWQLAYAEFLFVDVFWPDFTKEHLVKAIDAYRRRDRRFGGLSETIKA
ncbi:MAG: isoprenyl transferase [Hyphomicrobiaceae bacterium]